MEVQLELYASLMGYLPPGADCHRVRLEVAPGITAHGLLDHCGVPRAQTHLVLRNGVFLHAAERDRVALEDGDVLAAWPPVAGG
ncbi:MAG: MoaD/ThiS family protein [Gammaproteobacteria bacterium]|nr:MoaD/ThiS family protein [Gammaproteobacteria bacterium]